MGTGPIFSLSFFYGNKGQLPAENGILRKMGTGPIFSFFKGVVHSEKVACLLFLLCILYFLDYLEKSLGRIDS